jgi:GalNAc-alpha-(1->4)-GalNAc-alpha-(1->3)-diNAcBac-PP-undecaprenol alpha-1,4-N-acetyl-D-galactosaminyltransferase
MPLSVLSIARLTHGEQIDVIIDYMELRHLYLFPTYLIAKWILGKKVIYWGQGRDLGDRESKLKNLAYAVELALSDAIILYAEHLKKYVPRRFHKKLFVANNTLCLNHSGLRAGVTRENVLSKYGIKTRKNIICMGRMQKRKRLENVVEALIHMKRADIGLILVGPDEDGVLDRTQGDNIYKLGPIYGEEKYDLLCSADAYCLPGAVGLSIIDAFHCGLPFVTEEGDESAEIMYLKHGVNGFVVPRGDVRQMAEKLQLLLDDDGLRERFSREAKREISTNGHIDMMCKGFSDALRFVCRQS